MIKSEIFYDNGILNKNKLRESWIIKHLPNEYNEILKFNIGNIKFSNVIYNYINNIMNPPKCKNCNTGPKRFIGFNEGYNEFCSHSCALKFSSAEAQLKRKKTTLEKWGVEHTSQLKSVKEKQAKTNISKYGYISPTMNSEVKQKQETTMIKNWGVKYSGQSNELFIKSMSTRFEKYKSEVLERFKDLNIINVLSEGDLEIKCDKCLNTYKIRTEFLRLRYFRYKIESCTFCNPISSYKYTSQNEIFDFLYSFNIEIERNNRKILKGKEIDIYLPQYKIGIEFNGLYWHSTNFKSSKYHLEKKKICEEQGINLIHIWEDDWIYKKDIVKSRLENLMCKSDERIFARNCEIRLLDYKTCSDFLKENHLQLDVKSSYQIGLFNKDRLVSLMSFGKLRRCLGSKSKDENYELLRFCNLQKTNVIGSFSKLLKYFIVNKSPNKIISYINRDWSVKFNNVYQKNGFKLISETKPNYWYFDGVILRKHRFNFRKDVLIKEGFEGQTEKEIMFNRGYSKIYDCGSLKYELNLSKGSDLNRISTLEV